MSEIQKLSLTVLHTIAEFLALLPADQLDDLAEGTARLAIIPKDATEPLALVAGQSPARRAGGRRSVDAAGADMSETIDRLAKLTSRGEALAMLDPMPVKHQLQPLADQLGMSGYRGYKKADLVGAIIEFTVGNRLNSGAIRQL